MRRVSGFASFAVATRRREGSIIDSYVHGHDAREQLRLQDQAEALEGLLHADTWYPDGSTVLEAGCGTGAQTVTLARNSPGAQITCVDVAADALAAAKARAHEGGLTNVAFQHADILDLPFDPGSFDHVFVCFVLEHLTRPVEALDGLRQVLKPGGTITVIEGDHGSAYFHPDSDAARAAIRCQVELQRQAGGNALIGRQLYPLLGEAGYVAVGVSPRMVYADASKPALVEGFVKQTFIAMVEGVREPAIEGGMITPERFDAGVRDLYRTTEEDGVFSYTFLKATGDKLLRDGPV